MVWLCYDLSDENEAFIKEQEEHVKTSLKCEVDRIEAENTNGRNMSHPRQKD